VVALALVAAPITAVDAQATGTVFTAVNPDKKVIQPSNMKVTKTSNTAVVITWSKVSKAVKYRVKYSTSSSMKNAKYADTKTNERKLTSLKKNKTYYIKVVALDSKGKWIGKYSPVFKVKTPNRKDTTLFAPETIKVKSVTDTTATLTWAKDDRATKYRVRYSTSSNFASAKTVVLKDPAGSTVTGLLPWTTYYFSVRAVNASGLNMSPYSASVSAKTKSPAATEIPAQPSATALSASTAQVTWQPVVGAVYYQVQNTCSDWDHATERIVDGLTLTVGGLETKTKCSFRVRTTNEKNKALSDYSKAGTATTFDTPTTVNLATYNVRHVTSPAASTEEKSWADRRLALRDMIQSRDLDVIGVQEASTLGLVLTSGASKTSITIYEDLINLLGEHWALSDTSRYNCKKSTTKSSCTYVDQGASFGTRILYRKDRLEMQASGSRLLTTPSGGTTERYVAWAIFKQIATGKRFMFTTTHLEYLKSPVTRMNEARRVQAAEIVQTVFDNNPENLPVFITGDFNSNKLQVPSNTPYDEITAYGFIDPIANVPTGAYQPAATAQNMINVKYNTFNNWTRTLPRHTSGKGANIDYIFTSPTVPVLEYETVVNVDANGRWVGMFPSDHNMLRAQVSIPDPEVQYDPVVDPTVPVDPVVPA
jgi:endonuclease/exonuclease/phosphatase family metal-dependent hydrolase/fibronectin type 3 domain-containing protein